MIEKEKKEEEAKIKAEADAAKKAQDEIDAAKKAAIGELHAQASTLAVAIAGKILDREISAVDQQALVNETLAEMANTK